MPDPAAYPPDDPANYHPSGQSHGGGSLKSGPKKDFQKGKGNWNGKPDIKPGSPEDSLRSMPVNADAERAAISCMLLDPNDIIPKAIEKMNPDFFYVPAHKEIYKALHHLYKTRPEGKLDMVVLTTELRDKEKLDAVGGPKMLAELVDDVPTTALFDDYVGFLKE